jgi:hypothetical protein
MHNKAIGFVILALSFSVASGQSPGQPQQERAFQFAHTQTVLSAQEIAAVIKMIAGITQVGLSTETPPLTLTARGDAEQLVLAEWLFVELDQPVPAQAGTLVQEYRLPGVGENVVRLYHVANVATARELNELATAVRAVSDLRLLTTHIAQRAVIARGTADRLGVAEWLLRQMDKGRNEPIQHSATSKHLIQDPTDQGVLQVLYMAHAESFQDFQVVATAIRTTAEVRWIFTYNPSKALAIRGKAGQVATAEWLFNELDQPMLSPVSAPQNQAAARIYRVPDSIDDVLRVFYVTRAATGADVDKTAVQVRMATGSSWVFPYESHRVIVFRGTTAQMAQAERAIEEMNKP